MTPTSQENRKRRSPAQKCLKGRGQAFLWVPPQIVSLSPVFSRKCADCIRSASELNQLLPALGELREAPLQSRGSQNHCLTASGPSSCPIGSPSSSLGHCPSVDAQTQGERAPCWFSLLHPPVSSAEGLSLALCSR